MERGVKGWGGMWCVKGEGWEEWHERGGVGRAVAIKRERW